MYWLVYICKRIRDLYMKRLYFVLLVSTLFTVATAQRVARSYIPHGAFFYDSQWKGVSSADKAAYYRVLAIDDKGQKMFYDYYITGQLQAEKHYISINRQNDRNTVLNGVCRTFHKSGRVESVLQYKNGKANGRALSFFPSGNIGMKLSYRNGVLDGPCYTYTENGRLEFTTIWRNGSKVNEIKGGKDHYIDKNTNEDEFSERYRHDEALIMAQSKSIYKARENKEQKVEVKATKKLNSNPTTESKETQPAHDDLAKKERTNSINKVKEVASSQTPKEDKYLANIKYPDTPNEKAGTISDKMSSDGIIPQKGRFNFTYLHSLLSKENERSKSIDVLTGISHNFQLNSSQIIDGFGAQKEVVFHHNMIYDVQNSKDKVTGSKPRQIGFFGTIIGSNLFIDRINIFTWSEEEMYLIAQEAINAGYKTLGGIDYKSTDGNFILEPKIKPMDYGEREVIVTFTHQSNLYAGLYHIQMDIK